MELNKLKSMWIAKGSLKVPMLKMSSFWNDCKGVNNPPVLFVLNAGVVEDTGGSWLGFYNLYSLGIT